LENNGNIKQIDISRNKIKKSLLNIGINGGIRRGLEILNASHNLIPDNELENVSSLISSFTSLKTLDLYGNPLSNNVSYKYRLCVNPSLTRLDGLDLSPGSLLRKRLDTLRSEWETNRLID